jgi:hypothetical protein
VKLPHHFIAEVRQPDGMLSENTARRGDEGKAVGCVPPTALLSVNNPRSDDGTGSTHRDGDMGGSAS